jgi:metallo-beta-lactamase family protein
LLYFLSELWNDNDLPRIPTFVDSPLSTKATAVHAAHPECYDEDAVELFDECKGPFGCGPIRYTASVDESKELNEMKGPMIIISASGMCEGGRVLHHLKNNIEDRDNIVLIVGYQAEHTLGRRLVKKMDPIRIFGEEYALRAEVHSIQALSAHADHSEMAEYFRMMGPGDVRRAFVVHGELDQAEPFAKILGELGMRDVVIPKRGDIFDA